MTEPEEYVWWDRNEHLNIGHVVGERDHLIHHRFPDPGGRGHQLATGCHCDPELIEVNERFEVWRHRLIRRTDKITDNRGDTPMSRDPSRTHREKRIVHG